MMEDKIPEKEAPLGPDFLHIKVREFASWITFGVFDPAATKHDFYFNVKTILTMEEANDLFKVDLKKAWRAIDGRTFRGAVKRQYLRGMSHVFHFLVTTFGRLAYAGNEMEIIARRIIKNEMKAELVEISRMRTELFNRLNELNDKDELDKKSS